MWWWFTIAVPTWMVLTINLTGLPLDVPWSILAPGEAMGYQQWEHRQLELENWKWIQRELGSHREKPQIQQFTMRVATKFLGKEGLGISWCLLMNNDLQNNLVRFLARHRQIELRQLRDLAPLWYCWNRSSTLFEDICHGQVASH